MVSDPLGPGVWYPPQLTNRHAPAVGLGAGWDGVGGVGRGIGPVQGGLAEPPGPAVALGTCPAVISPLTRRTSKAHGGLLYLFARTLHSTGHWEALKDPEGRGHPGGRKGWCTGVVAGLVEASGGGRGSGRSSLPPPTRLLLLSALPGSDWLLCLSCDPLLPSASQALLPG